MSWMAIFSPPQMTRRPKRLRPSEGEGVATGSAAGGEERG